MMIFIAVLFFMIGATIGAAVTLLYHKQDKSAYSVVLKKLIMAGNTEQALKLLSSYEVASREPWSAPR